MVLSPILTLNPSMTTMPLLSLSHFSSPTYPTTHPNSSIAPHRPTCHYCRHHNYHPNPHTVHLTHWPSYHNGHHNNYPYHLVTTHLRGCHEAWVGDWLGSEVGWGIAPPTTNAPRPLLSSLQLPSTPTQTNMKILINSFKRLHSNSYQSNVC